MIGLKKKLIELAQHAEETGVLELDMDKLSEEAFENSLKKLSKKMSSD